MMPHAKIDGKKNPDGICTFGTTRSSLLPIQRGFAPSICKLQKGCTRLAAASDKVYQLLAHGRWFSPGTPACSTTKTDRHDIAESGVKHKKIKSILLVFPSLLVIF
jgi:hypothetical protein